MTRRLLAQLGLAALALATTGGMALADSSPIAAPVAPGTNQQQNSNSNVNLTTDGGGSVTIQNSQTTNQQIGGGGAPGSNTGPGSGPGSSLGNGSDPSQSATAPDQTTLSSSTTTHTPSISPDATPPPTAGADPAANIATASGGGTGSGGPAAITAELHRAAAVVASAPRPTLVQAAAASDVPQPPTPGAPHAPVGLLNQLHLMMALVVPTNQTLPGLAAETALASILIILGLTALRGSARHLTPNSYTARLRQSGFLGAARSDVGAGHLSFATPLEMGCISRGYAT